MPREGILGVADRFCCTRATWPAPLIIGMDADEGHGQGMANKDGTEVTDD